MISPFLSILRLPFLPRICCIWTALIAVDSSPLPPLRILHKRTLFSPGLTHDTCNGILRYYASTLPSSACITRPISSCPATCRSCGFDTGCDIGLASGGRIQGHRKEDSPAVDSGAGAAGITMHGYRYRKEIRIGGGHKHVIKIRRGKSRAGASECDMKVSRNLSYIHDYFVFSSESQISRL